MRTLRLCALVALGLAFGYAFSDAAMAQNDRVGNHSQQPAASAQ
jgi:hypothetical protein